MKILEGLIPDLQAKAKALVDECDDAGFPIRITSGLRTWEEQEQLYTQGRTAPGQIVTRAKPGMSWHNWGRAFDFCFDHKEPFGEQHPWTKVGELGEKLGLEWGGRFTKPDRPHFQLEGNILCFSRGAIKKEGVIDLVPPMTRWSKPITGFGAIQRLLRKSGLYDGELDGVIGPKTAQAIERLLGRSYFSIDDIEIFEGLGQ